MVAGVIIKEREIELVQNYGSGGVPGIQSDRGQKFLRADPSKNKSSAGGATQSRISFVGVIFVIIFYYFWQV